MSKYPSTGERTKFTKVIRVVLFDARLDALEQKVRLKHHKRLQVETFFSGWPFVEVYTSKGSMLLMFIQGVRSDGPSTTAALYS